MTDVTFFSWIESTMREARRNKRYGRDCCEFELMWVPNLVRLMHELQDKSFRVDRNYAFLVYIPKWREIFATSFEGRIADHLLCDTLAPYIEATLHPRTYNNRKGMGQQAAINRVVDDICEVSEGYTRPCRIIKWDLKAFFPNALCGKIEQCFHSLIDDNRDDIISRYDEDMPDFLKWLATICVHCNPAAHCERRSPAQLWQEHIDPEKSLFGKAPGVGTPIGRLPSQVGMGLYLNDDIAWLNDECGIPSTLFMDDCTEVVTLEQHAFALSLMPELRLRLAAKGIRLNEKKFYDQPYEYGLEFLGSHIKVGRIHLNRDTYYRAVCRIRDLNRCCNKEKIIDKMQSSFNSYAGMLKSRTDYGRLERLREMLHPDWWQYFTYNERRRCLQCTPEYSKKARLKRKFNLKLKTL